MPARRVPRASSARSTRLPDEVRVDPNQLALLLENAVRAGSVPPAATVTLAEHWAWWVPRFLGRLARPKEFVYRVEKCLLPDLGALTQDTLTPDAIELCFAGLEKTRKPGTINTVRAAGIKLVNDLIRAKRWTAANAFAQTQSRRVAKISPYILTLEEARSVVAAAGKLAPRWALLFGLGPRYGEMRGLQVEDWDHQSKRLTIKRSGHRDTTKTGRTRVIPVPDWLAIYLDRAKAEAKGRWLFPGRGPDKQLCRESGRILAGLLRRAGVVAGYRYWCGRKVCGHKEVRAFFEFVRCPACDRPLRANGIPRHMRVHDARHNFVSMAMEAGTHPAVVALVVGHAHTNITSGTYTHFRDSHVRSELSRLDLTPTPLETQMVAKKRALRSYRKEQRSATTATAPARTEADVTATATPGPLLTTEEVALRLRCSKQTVRRLVHRGELKALTYSSDYRILESSLADLVTRHTGTGVP